MDPEALREQYKADLAKVEEKLPLYSNVENAEAYKQLLAIKAHFTAKLEALGPEAPSGPERDQGPPPPTADAVDPGNVPGLPSYHPAQRDGRPVSVMGALRGAVDRPPQTRAEEIIGHPDGRDKPSAPFFPSPSMLGELDDAVGASMYRAGGGKGSAYGNTMDAVGELLGEIPGLRSYYPAEREAQQKRHPAPTATVGGVEIPYGEIGERTLGMGASLAGGVGRGVNEIASRAVAPAVERAIRPGALRTLASGGATGAVGNALAGLPTNVDRNLQAGKSPLDTAEQISWDMLNDATVGGALGAGIPGTIMAAGKIPEGVGWGAGKVADFIRRGNKNIQAVERGGGQVGVRGIKNAPSARAGLEATPAGQGEAGDRATKALIGSRGQVEQANEGTYERQFGRATGLEGESTKMSTEQVINWARDELKKGNADPGRAKFMTNFLKLLTENGRLEPTQVFYTAEPHGGGSWDDAVKQAPPSMAPPTAGDRRVNADTGEVSHRPQRAPTAPAELVERYSMVQRPDYEVEVQEPMILESGPLDIPPSPPAGVSSLLANAKRTYGGGQPEPPPVPPQDPLLAAARASTAGLPPPRVPALPPPEVSAAPSPLSETMPATMAVPMTVTPPPVPKLQGHEMVGPSLSAGGGSLGTMEGRTGGPGLLETPDGWPILSEDGYPRFGASAAPGRVMKTVAPTDEGNLRGRFGDDPNHYLSAEDANRFKVQLRQMPDPAAQEAADKLMNLVDDHTVDMSAANKAYHRTQKSLEDTAPLVPGEAEQSLKNRAMHFGDETKTGSGGHRADIEQLLAKSPLVSEQPRLWPEIMVKRPAGVPITKSQMRGDFKKLQSDMLTRPQLREKFDLPRQILGEQRLQFGRPGWDIGAGVATGSAAGALVGGPPGAAIGGGLGGLVGAMGSANPYSARLAYPALRGMEKMGPGMGRDAVARAGHTVPYPQGSGTNPFPSLIPPMSDIDIELMFAEAQRRRQAESDAQAQAEAQATRKRNDKLFQAGEAL
jgi:hypothetical protein